MEKLDLAKTDKRYYRAKTEPELLEIGRAQFLSITGKGDPSGETFAEKLQTLYPVAYAIKFMCKGLGNDFVVAKLEGLWSFDEALYQNLTVTEAPAKVPRSEWNYRMLIRMPEFVTKEQVDLAIQKVISKKSNLMANEVELFEMNEGMVIQILHTGPFSEEPATLKKIMEFSDDKGLIKNGLHHEIYLSDFRKTAPEKLKTILREPVKQGMKRS